MADRADITPELCRQLLRYDPETGKLYWRERPREMFRDSRGYAAWSARYPGREAFTALSRGYRTGKILDVQFFAHRVAWAIVHGAWPAPESDIDHINGDGCDNRMANLREVSHLQNGRNIKRPTSNTSGYIGVSWDARKRKWAAYIGARETRRFLGYFSTPSEAGQARVAAQLADGYHPNHGR